MLLGGIGMAQKAVVETEGMTLTFENNINGGITRGEIDELVYLELSSDDEKEYQSFGYDDAVGLRDFLDWLIDKADKECQEND